MKKKLLLLSLIVLFIPFAVFADGEKEKLNLSTLQDKYIEHVGETINIQIGTDKAAGIPMKIIDEKGNVLASFVTNEYKYYDFTITKNSPYGQQLTFVFEGNETYAPERKSVFVYFVPEEYTLSVSLDNYYGGGHINTTTLDIERPYYKKNDNLEWGYEEVEKCDLKNDANCLAFFDVIDNKLHLNGYDQGEIKNVTPDSTLEIVVDKDSAIYTNSQFGIFQKDGSLTISSSNNSALTIQQTYNNQSNAAIAACWNCYGTKTEKKVIIKGNVTIDADILNNAVLDDDVSRSARIIRARDGIVIEDNASVKGLIRFANTGGYVSSVNDLAIFSSKDIYINTNGSVEMDLSEVNSIYEARGFAPQHDVVIDNVKYLRLKRNENMNTCLISYYTVRISEELEARKIDMSEDTLTYSIVRVDPVVVKASVKNYGVNLNFEEDKVSKFIQTYTVYKSVYKDKKFKEVATVEKDQLPFVDRNVESGKTYYYKVIADYGILQSDASKVVSVTVKPDKVTGVYSKPGSTKHALSWEKANGSGYQVSRSTDNKKWTTIKTIKGSAATDYTDKKLKSNKTYYYKIRAFKTVNKKTTYGSWSAVYKTKTAPAKVTIKLSNTKDYKNKITITSVKGAVKYQISRSTDNKAFTIVDDSETLTYIDGTVEIGKTYYYKVRGCNSASVCGSYSSVVSIKTKPAKPGIKLLTPSKKITVAITKTSEVDGYQIYRSTSKSGKYKLRKELTGEEINNLNYQDNTKKGKTYYYKLRSFKIVDGKRVYSSYTSVKKLKSK